MPRTIFHTCCVLALFAKCAIASELPPDITAIRAAITKSLPLLEHSAQTSMELRKNCFTCHNQGLPIMTLVTARDRGFAIDDAGLTQQLQFTADFLARNRVNYREGRGQPGQTFMAGYALWALEYGGWPPDETTAAVAEYFLKYQSDDDHWSTRTDRPPSELSPFTASFLGIQSLRAFTTAEQQDRALARRQQVRDWLRTASAENTEDLVFRLLGLHASEASSADIQQATIDLLASQRTDGGWSQLETMDSDPYATATALVALHRAGNISATDDSYRRGISYLLKTQLPDGSWHVVSRSKPFQTYYESGYPHGNDQFISITAGCWATMALAFNLPIDPPADALAAQK